MKFFLIFLMILMIWACSNKNSKQNAQINSTDSVKVAEKALPILQEPLLIKFQESEKDHFEDLKLSEIASDIKYIPLETRNECLIGRRYDVKLTANNIFIGNDGMVLIFKRNGEFVCQINKKGRGPGECHSKFFKPDEERNCIYIYGLHQHKIFKYDFEGNFITKFEDPYLNKSTGKAESFGIGTETGDLFVTYGNAFGDSKYKLVILNKDDGSLLKSFKNYDIYKTNKNPIMFGFTRGKESIYHLDNKDYYKADFNDTIFSISGKNLKPHVIIDLGKDKWTLKENLELSCGLLNYNEVKDKTLIWGFYETSNNLFLKFNAQTSTFLGILDKTSNEFNQNFDIHNIKNDIDGGIPFDMSKTIYYKNEVAFSTSIIDLKEKYSKSHLDENEIHDTDRNKEFKEMLNVLNEDDNPVIIIAKLK